MVETVDSVQPRLQGTGEHGNRAGRLHSHRSENLLHSEAQSGLSLCLLIDRSQNTEAHLSILFSLKKRQMDSCVLLDGDVKPFL